jgi:hypothetical protein
VTPYNCHLHSCADNLQISVHEFKQAGRMVGRQGAYQILDRHVSTLSCLMCVMPDREIKSSSIPSILLHARLDSRVDMVTGVSHLGLDMGE